MHARIIETQGASPLAGHIDGRGDLRPRGLADVAIVADSFDVQKASVGLEADPPQRGEIVKPFANGEVARVETPPDWITQ